MQFGTAIRQHNFQASAFVQIPFSRSKLVPLLVQHNCEASLKRRHFLNTTCQEPATGQGARGVEPAQVNQGPPRFEWSRLFPKTAPQIHS